MKRLFRYLSLVVFLFIVICAREKITLQLNLEQGSTYTMRVTTEQKISQTMHEQKFDMNQTIIVEYFYDVVELNEEGNAIVKMTYRKVGFNQDGPMGRIDYKSWEEPTTVPMAAKAFAALVGKSLTMEISPQGRVSHISGTDKILDAILKEFDSPMDNAAKKETEQHLKRQFGEDAIRETMNDMFAIYPKKPVGVGDTWHGEAVMAMGFPVVIHNTWRLKGIKNGKVYLDVNSKIKPNSEASVTQMGMEMTYDVSGDQKGSMVLDESTGWLREAELKQQFEGKIVVSGAMYGEAQTMEYPVSISGSSTIETIEE